MTNSGKLFYGDLTYCFIESGFIHYQCQMSIYYKYSPYGRNMVVLSYVGDCVYLYTYEALVKMVCGHSRKEITCELPVICTLVYVNEYFRHDGPFRFIISG